MINIGYYSVMNTELYYNTVSGTITSFAGTNWSNWTNWTYWTNWTNWTNWMEQATRGRCTLTWTSVPGLSPPPSSIVKTDV